MKFKVVKGKRGKFVLRWDAGEGWKERTTDLAINESNRAKAYRLLSTLESELRGEIPPALSLPAKSKRLVRENEGKSDVDLGEWTAFREYFNENHLWQLSDGYAAVMLPIIGMFEDFAKPQHISECKTPLIRRWIRHEQKRTKTVDGKEQKIADATIHSYWRHLSAFLRVANEDGLLKEMPKVRLPKLDRQAMSKGRPLSLEEFERMLKQTETVRPDHFKEWKFALKGMWYGGLRIGELYRLTWDDSDFCIDLDREYPCFKIKGMGQKSRKTQTLPITPDFVAELQTVPKSQRYGRVYQFPALRGSEEELSQRQVEKVISKIGKKACVRVGKSKSASSHDLRRSFGTRWALKVTPQVLQKLMRHSDIQTTMRYYVDMDSDDLAKVIYDAGGHEGGQLPRKKKSAGDRRK